MGYKSWLSTRTTMMFNKWRVATSINLNTTLSIDGERGGRYHGAFSAWNTIGGPRVTFEVEGVSTGEVGITHEADAIGQTCIEI